MLPCSPTIQASDGLSVHCRGVVVSLPEKEEDAAVTVLIALVGPIRLSPSASRPCLRRDT